ncbi:MAG: hypothetical protein OXC82_14060 [Rhodobacteraceae bacterium]|nr:hypothetical protein [Paracoccaceae bacterium]
MASIQRNRELLQGQSIVTANTDREAERTQSIGHHSWANVQWEKGSE